MNDMDCFYAAFFPCAAFHFARASRCCFTVSSDRCLSQMYPNRGPREMFLHPSTRQRMSRLRPPGRAARASLAAVWFALARSTRMRSEEHTSELQSRLHLVCRLLLEKKKKQYV